MDNPHFVFTHLTFGFPGPTAQLVQSWVGRRFVWWPTCIPARPWLSIISSRLGRPLFRHTQWFAELRAACQAAQEHGDTLVFAEKTTTAKWLERCAHLYQLPTLRLVLPRQKLSLDRWLSERLASDAPHRADTGHYVAHVSPPLEPHESSTPERDALTVVVPDRIIALQVRPNGHIERLLNRREADDGLKPLSVRSPSQTGVKPAPSPPSPPSTPRINPNHVPANWLVHWTRQQDKPWPDETEAEYLDALIMSYPSSDHSALATLRRIVRQRCLRASTNAIRGGLPVVCFSATPLAKMSERRIFRPHRGRWDFELYGICIDSDWLMSIGTRPVMYGEDELWDRLSAQQRPFFQKRSGSAGEIDWSTEREWRHLGDIQLNSLPTDAAVLFVPTCSDARELDHISPWPVVVLERV